MKYLLKDFLLIFLLSQFYRCGNAASDKVTSSNDAAASPKEEPVAKKSESKSGTITWVMNGRKMQAIDYRCSWILDKTTNVFNFTAFWEKASTRVDLKKHLGCNVYNCFSGPSAYYPIPHLISLRNRDPACSISVNLHEEDFNGIYTVKSTENGGEVKITKLDTLNHLVSGTFYGTMVGRDHKQFEIKDGRFENLTCNMVYDLDGEKKKAQEVIDKMDMKKTTDKVKEMEKKSEKHKS